MAARKSATGIALRFLPVSALSVRGRPAAALLAWRCQRSVSTEAKLEHVSDLLDNACKTNLGGQRKQTCEAWLETYESLTPEEQAAWWIRTVEYDESRQLDALHKALPRGAGRVGAQMLDAIVPVGQTLVERLAKQLVDSLGAPRGLAQVIKLRTAVQAAALVPEAWNSTNALERLDRQLQRALSLWLSPGLLEVVSITKESPLSWVTAAEQVARKSVPAFHALPNQRSFALVHKTAEDARHDCPSLLTIIASMHAGHPGSSEVAAGPFPEGSEPTVACCWAFESSAALKGLGLESEFFDRVIEHLSTESSSPTVTALVPLNGFAAWLQKRKPWEGEDLPEHLCNALKRVVAQELPEPRNLSFTDGDGDVIGFTSLPGSHLDATVGTDGNARRVSGLRLSETEGGGCDLVLILEPNSEGMQVSVPPEVVKSGDMSLLSEMWAETSGEVEAVLLRHARTFLELQHPGGKTVVHPHVHLHLSLGAMLKALHCQMPTAGSSLSLLATFAYDPAAQEGNRQAYVESGSIAIAAG
mmetsp:Transcript_19067/g.34511  ORF Transcript_19067/g.34511 Transcript_19067/m.34511 type:complete len:530 (-) Transcript_19067:24-1613(-)